MKKTIAAVLALSLLGLTACGQKADPIGEEPQVAVAENFMETTTQRAATKATTATTATETETATEKHTKSSTSTSSDKATTTASSSSTAVPSTAAGTAATTAAATRSGGSSGNTGTKAPVSTTKAPASTTKAPASTTKAPAATTKAPAATTAKADTTMTHKATTAATTAETTTTAAPPTDAPTEILTDPPTDPPVQDGITRMVNGILVANSGTDHPRAIEPFSGNYNNSARYAQVLNSYKATLGDAVNVWCMVVPTSQAFYTPDDVKAQYGDQLDHFNKMCEIFDGVTGIPVYEVLDAHKEEQTYSRTDYHWQPLAAYYAAEQFSAFAGVPYAPLDTYEAVVREGYLGAFYRVNGVSELGDHPEQFTYYKPANLDQIVCTYYNNSFGGAHQGSLFFENNSIGASYTVFVGTDDCILQVDTNVENDRVLVIFKDSYGNALVPFLTQSFSKIYLCDFRYFNRNAASFIQEVGATDLLFAMSTVADCTSSKVDLVANNLVK